MALAIVPARSLTAPSVKGVLAKLFAVRGKPATIRSDNGPEFIAFELTEWLEAQGATTHHIEPGKPWRNSFAESFKNRIRDECLNMNEFRGIEHARVVLEAWRIEFNTEHPHSSLVYKTPAQFAARWGRGRVSYHEGKPEPLTAERYSEWDQTKCTLRGEESAGCAC